VLLFQKTFHRGLVDGSITLTFRRWAKPHVKPGGRYRCHPIGVLVVDAIERVRVATVDETDARRAGFVDREALLAFLRSGPNPAPLDDSTEIFRIALHHGGDGDRVEIAMDAALGEADVARIRDELAKFDHEAPWTAETLAIIDARPRTAASQLAAALGRETAPFKVDVRKLKRLGLTQSFEVGYELSPRGRAYLAKATKQRTRRSESTARSAKRTR
jgi:hypothetical protein